MTLLGSMFGPDDPTNQQVIDEMKKGFEKMGKRFDSIDQTLGEIKDSLDVVHDVVLYNQDLLVEMKHKAMMDPFNDIHSKYLTLMDELPSDTNGRSWGKFFDTAKSYTIEVKEEIYDSFKVGKIKSFLEWWGGTPQNDMGMCGQSFIFNFILSVRHELFFIMTMGHVQHDEDSNVVLDPNTKFPGKRSAATEDDIRILMGQLEEFTEEILDPTRKGGLGLGHLVGRTPRELREGANSAKLGFCYRCRDDGKRYTVKKPPANKSTFPGQFKGNWGNSYLGKSQSCNVAKASLDVSYWEETGGNVWCGNGTPGADNLKLKKISTTSDKIDTQVLNIRGHWEDGCRTCGRNLEERGTIKSGWSCPKAWTGIWLKARFTTLPPKIWTKESRDVVGKRENYQTCPCSCQGKSEYKENSGYPLAGTHADHQLYATHCPDSELVYSGGPDHQDGWTDRFDLE